MPKTRTQMLSFLTILT